MLSAYNVSKIFESGSKGKGMSDRKRWLALAVGVAISSIPGWAQDQAQQTTDQKIQQLEQKVDALEKEVKADETTDGGQSAGAVSADYINGFTIRSKDGNFCAAHRRRSAGR